MRRSSSFDIDCRSIPFKPVDQIPIWCRYEMPIESDLMRLSFLPLLLLVVPIVEIAVFILIGGQIGIGWTLLMILVTAIIGTFLLRQEGLKVFHEIQTETQAGRVPGKALGTGAMILVAGVLLLTPGFVTDSIGFLLFVPGVRNAIWSFLARHIKVVTPAGPMADSPRRDQGQGPIVDLDADEFTSGPPNPNSPWKSGNDR